MHSQHMPQQTLSCLPLAHAFSHCWNLLLTPKTPPHHLQYLISFQPRLSLIAGSIYNALPDLMAYLFTLITVSEAYRLLITHGDGAMQLSLIGSNPSSQGRRSECPDCNSYPWRGCCC